MYFNVASEKASLYIPNRDKQPLFPSLKFEEGDVLQNLIDKGILKNNTNISIPINNTSAQPLISDTGNITDIKWSTIKNVSINESRSKELIDPPTEPKNLQSSDLPNAYNSKSKAGLNAPTDKPTLFQTPNPNSRSNLNKNRWENLGRYDYTKRPTKSALNYHGPEYGISPYLRKPMKHDKKRRPSTIGFNQVPYIISQIQKPELNLSQIVSDKNNIVHLTSNNHRKISILQPNGLILPDNSANEASINTIRAPVKLNMVRVPHSHNIISLDRGSPKSEVDLTMIQSQLPNLEGRSNNLVLDLSNVPVPTNGPSLGGSPNNLVDDLSNVQVPAYGPSLGGDPNNYEVDPNMIQIHQNLLNLKERSERLGVDLKKIQVPPNRPDLKETLDNLDINPYTIRISPNHPNLRKRLDNLDVDLDIIEVNPNPSNSADNPDSLKVGHNDQNTYMIKTPPNELQSLRMNNLFSDWFYNQIATVNKRLDIQINIDTLKKDIIKTLARYNMYISEDGYLIDVQGNILNWDHLQLRTILVGEPMEYETVINSPDPIHFEPSNTYWKALLTTFGPSSQMIILDIIPLGKMKLHEKSDVKVKVPINSHICKSEYCKPELGPVQPGCCQHAMPATSQSYLQLQAQQLNIEQLLNRRNLGSKLDNRKEPLHIYNKHEGLESSKIRKETLTKSGRREKDPIDVTARGMPPRAPNSHVVDWRIIGGAAATSSGAPISVRGRSGYIF